MRYTEIKKRVRSTIPDEMLTEQETEECISKALLKISKVSPRERSKEYTGDGTTFSFSLPDDWDNDLSAILCVEYPAGQRIPTFLTQDEFFILDSQFRLIQAPAKDKKVKLFYTTAHELTATENTLSSQEELALLKAACGEGCRILASKYLRMFEPEFITEGIDYGRKAEDYRALAESYEEEFRRIVVTLPVSTAKVVQPSKWKEIRKQYKYF